MLKKVGQQGQTKLQPTERDLALAGALAGVSSACSLWGGQLSRPEETERSLWNTYSVKQVLGLRSKPIWNIYPGHLGQQEPHFSLPTSSLLSFTLCCSTSRWARHLFS